MDETMNRDNDGDRLGEGETPSRARRSKYISRACQACRRRKSKCSGHDTCSSCQDRGLECIYATGKRCRRKRVVRTQRDSRGAADDFTRPSREAIGPPRVVSQPAWSSPRATLYRSIGCDQRGVSLGSQIARARASFTNVQDAAAEPYHISGTYAIELPPISYVKASLQAYFVNTNLDYPALDRPSTEGRIYRVLNGLGYSSYCHKVDVDSAAAPSIALLCLMVAIAELTHARTSSAAIFYDQAQQLLRRFDHRPPDLEVVRCHVLSTIYLLHMEFLDLALWSISTSVRLAMLLQLHRPSPTRISGAEHGRSDRDAQDLWWTVYILDRTIARLSGTSYLIRDEEIGFSKVTYMSPTCERNTMGQSEDSEYLQVLAHLGRLWARIWDDLLSHAEATGCEWQTAELLDAQIRLFQRQLPPRLVWSSPPGPDADLPEEHEHVIRRRLTTLMTLNTLRLLIRRNAVSDCMCLDTNGPSGTAIAGEVIDAIASLKDHRRFLRSLGFTIATTLVQCVVFLVNVVSEAPDHSQSECASSYVESAYRVLTDMAESSTSVRSAVEVLDTILFSLPQQGTISAERSRPPETPFQQQQLGERRSHLLASPPPSGPEASANKDLFKRLEQGYDGLDSLSLDEL